MILECYADEELVKVLGKRKREIIHAGGRDRVCKMMKKMKNSIGLIDEDPDSSHSPYIDELGIVIYENGIRLLFDEKRHNHVIVLCPKLEDWILKASKEVNISVTEYSLPRDPYELHKVTTESPKKFIPLIKEIINRDSNMLKTLEELVNNNHKSLRR